MKTKADFLVDMVIALVDARTSVEGVPIADIRLLAGLIDGDYKTTRIVNAWAIPGKPKEQWLLQFQFSDNSNVCYSDD